MNYDIQQAFRTFSPENQHFKTFIMLKKLPFTIFIAVLTFSVNHAQLGDIAFSGVNHDGADDFSIVLIRDYTSGEQIEFTDNGWFAAGGFRTGEGTMLFTFGGNYVAGTQIILYGDGTQPIDQTGASAGTTVEVGGFSLSSTGDVIFAYDPGNVPAAGNESGFIAAIHMNGPWDADATSSTTSAKPAVFTDGVNSIVISPEADNARFFDCAEGLGATDAANLRSILNDGTNWESDNTTPYPLSPPLCDLSAVLSIEDATLRRNIETYPNPANGELFVRNSNNSPLKNAELADISGRVVRSFDLRDVNIEERLDLSGLTSGIYILKVNSENASFSEKLVIE